MEKKVKNEDICIEESSECGSKVKKILKVLAIIAVINIAINTLVKYFKKRSSELEKRNDIREIKEYYNYCNGKNLKVTADEEFKGMLLHTVMGGIKLDLSEAVIPDGAFVSIKAVMSGVDIIVPENIQVVVSGANAMSGIACADACDDESANKLYIVGKYVMSGISVRTAKADREE